MSIKKYSGLFNGRTAFVVGMLFGLCSAQAAPADDEDCAMARDPARCESRQAALASCAEMHGAYKRACLEQAMPAVDCSKSKRPESCERAQKAKDAVREACKGKTGDELVQCFKDNQPKKAKKKSAKGKAKATGKKADKARKPVKAKKKTG